VAAARRPGCRRGDHAQRAAPGPLLAWPRLTFPVIGSLLFLPLLIANPKRMTREIPLFRALAVILVVLLIAANSVSPVACSSARSCSRGLFR
jgi:hypothetical protein